MLSTGIHFQALPMEQEKINQEERQLGAPVQIIDRPAAGLFGNHVRLMVV
jgi:hypothetical protein